MINPNPENFSLTPEGTIANPGKFEGSELWVPYFHGLSLEGEGEDIWSEDDEPVSEGIEFVVDAEEANAFGLEIGSHVCVHEDEYGFVQGWILP